MFTYTSLRIAASKINNHYRYKKLMIFDKNTKRLTADKRSIKDYTKLREQPINRRALSLISSNFNENIKILKLIFYFGKI